MKAIFTKWIGPTMTKPARIKAYDGDNSRTWSFSGLENATQNKEQFDVTLNGLHDRRRTWLSTTQAVHYEAARRFIAAMNWDYSDEELISIAGGGTKEGFVWVMLPR